MSQNSFALLLLTTLMVWLCCQTGCDVRQEPVETVNHADKDNLWTRDGLDWPSFLGPNRNSSSAETGLRFNWSEDTPATVWSRRFGTGYGIGSLAAGRYFHFDRHRNEARLRAFHAETGQQLWEFSYPTDYEDMFGFDNGPRSSPVVDGDRVYIHGVEGMLYCLNAKTGEQIWEVNTAKKFGVIQNFFGVGSSPLIFDDLLITMIGGSPPRSQAVPFGQLDQVEPNGNAIVAFNKLTGEVRYKTINDLASYASPVISEIKGQLVGLAFCRSGLFSFDPKTGESGFEFPFRAQKFASVNASTPIIVDSRILITESYGPGGALLQYTDGQVKTIWADNGPRDASIACHWNTPVVVDGYIYASSGEKTSAAQLRCVRLADAKIMWQEPGLGRASLTSADGHIVCLAETGRLFVFKPDPEGLNIVGEYPGEDPGLVSPCWAAPVISHGYLYVRGKSKVLCLDIKR